MEIFKLIKNILFPIELTQEEISNIRIKQKKLRDELWNEIVAKRYTVNHLHHYLFTMNGESNVYGIVELVGIFGTDFLRKAEIEHQKILKEQEIVKFNNDIKLINC